MTWSLVAPWLQNYTGQVLPPVDNNGVPYTAGTFSTAAWSNTVGAPA